MRIHKKTIAAAVLAAFGAATTGATANAADEVNVIVQGTAHQALYAVSFSGNNGVAVGGHGEVQTTEDMGKTWKESKVDTDMALLAVHLDASKTIAVGQAGTAFAKSGSGNWEKLDLGTTKRLFGVGGNTAGLTVVVGEFGTILISEDGGKQFSPVAVDWTKYVADDTGAEPHLYGVDVAPDGAITAVGEFGLIIRSVDHGKTWSMRSRGDASLFAVDIREDGNGFAVGQDGMVMKTWNHGDSWTCIDTGSRAILTGVSSTADGKVMVSGMREGMTSKDDGTNWQRIDNPEVTTVWYVGVAEPGQGGALMVGQAGRIIKLGS